MRQQDGFAQSSRGHTAFERKFVAVGVCPIICSAGGLLAQAISGSPPVDISFLPSYALLRNRLDRHAHLLALLRANWLA